MSAKENQKKEIGMKVVLRCLLFLLFTLAFANFVAAANQEITPVGPETGVSAAASGPVIEVPEKDFNFGELKDGNDYVHDFKIKNAGTASLQIKKVMPG
jgi:hypothetical protein